MTKRFRSSFAAPTGFVAAVTRSKPRPSAEITRLPTPRPATAPPLSDGSTKQAA